MENEVFLSQEGYEELKNELEYLKSVKRHEVAEKIKTAREFGDLSENAEYDAAKEEQAQTEGKIIQIEAQLKNAKIINEATVNTKTVQAGAIVKVYDYKYEEEVEYKIVGVTEADITKNWISNDCPVGKGLIGKKKNDVVEITTPQGIAKFKVLEIKRG